MDWFYAGPFIRDASHRWLTEFVPNGDAALRFHAVPAHHRHAAGDVKGWKAWLDHFEHGRDVWARARGQGEPSGILTSFPELAVAVGLRKRFSPSKMPVVAWTFNVGRLYRDARQKLARAALSSVDKFVVHSRAERSSYSEWLDLPEERFSFVPFQRPIWSISAAEDVERPFLLSMGSAKRDYRLLFAVLSEVGYRAVVVADPYALEGLRVPGNVEVRSGLTLGECFELTQRARINVIPIANRDTGSGQTTVVDAMMHGRPVIVSACPGSVDYVSHERDGILVRQGDHDELKSAVQKVWDDSALRLSLGTQARRTATERFSDQAVAREMGRLLREVAGLPPERSATA